MPCKLLCTRIVHLFCRLHNLFCWVLSIYSFFLFAFKRKIYYSRSISKDPILKYVTMNLTLMSFVSVLVYYHPFSAEMFSWKHNSCRPFRLKFNVTNIDWWTKIFFFFKYICMKTDGIGGIASEVKYRKLQLSSYYILQPIWFNAQNQVY